MFANMDPSRPNPNSLEPHQFVHGPTVHNNMSFYATPSPLPPLPPPQQGRFSGFAHDCSPPPLQSHQAAALPSRPSSTADALLSEYQQFTTAMNQSFDSHQMNFASPLKREIPPMSPILPPMVESRTAACTSPEALLDIISTTQEKLQKLQSAVQMMVHGGGQPQQQQTLAASVASIMSQLFTATSGLLQQQVPVSLPVFSSATHVNPTFDLKFDGLNDDGPNNYLFPSLGSFLGGSHATFFPASIAGCSTLVGDSDSNSTLRVGPGCTEIGVGSMDHESKNQTLISSSPETGNHLSSGSMTRNDAAPNCVASGSSAVCQTENTKASPNIALEAVNYPSVEATANPKMLSFDNQDYGSSTMKDDDDDGESENLPPGSYELVEMGAAEILAEHTHFCDICGKGFKRDANLRMHMRGHGDEYKTPAALARPDKTTYNPSVVQLRRYSCPYVGCKRNRKHRKFQPLKTILCVKNHYRRSHCPKVLTCNKCKTKKFSVVADLKTHEKHCGLDKWQCSCGTTFSRKDKLIGHVGLFAGHTPMVPLNDVESPVVGGAESSSVCLSSTPNGIASTEAIYHSRTGIGSAAQGVRSTAMMNRGNHSMDMSSISIAGEEGSWGRDQLTAEYSSSR